MTADIAVMVVLYFLRVLYEIYSEAIPITNLPSHIVKGAIRLVGFFNR